MKYVSLFAGIGGFDLALNRLGHTCVWANEWDKYASSIYEYNFRNEKPVDTRDIRAVPTESIPDHDLLVGGFPCQAFSVAGKRRGFSDTRGTLFFEIARILKIKQPNYCILENVKGLLSHDNGNTFKTILATLDELRYDLQWQVVNSKNFGVPQNRERVFIIGNLRGAPRPEVFPITGNDEKDPRIVGQDIAYTIDSNYWKGTNTLEKSRRSLVNVSQAFRIRGINGVSSTLQGEAGGTGAKTGLYAIPLKFLNRNQKNYQGDYSFTVDSVNTGGILEGALVRRLTPLECERLQGFPDNWTKFGTNPDDNIVLVSDTQRYKCLGNAVTVNVVYEIARRAFNESNS